MDFSNLTERFTKKLGPLPIWAWAFIIVGVGYAAYRLTSGGAGGSAAATEATPDEGYSVDSPAGSADTFVPDSSTAGPIGSGSSSSFYPQPLANPGYVDSSGIGLGSYGEGNPLPVIIDSINPNLFMPTTAMDGGSSSSGNILPSPVTSSVASPPPTPAAVGAKTVQGVANAAAAIVAAQNAAIAAAKTAAVQQVQEARAAEARAAALAAEANTKKERAAAAAAAAEAARQRAQAQAAIEKSQKLQGKR